MARPRRIEGEQTARERMEEAFWAMLAEMPYNAMTAREVCVRARVSHNAFYYHFEGLDDMARKLFDRLTETDLPRALLSMLGSGVEASDLAAVPQLGERFGRLRLLAGSGSPYLAGLVRSEVRAAWLEAVGAAESELSENDRTDIDFVLGGIMAILASDRPLDAPSALASFAERDLGRAVIQRMSRLSQRGH